MFHRELVFVTKFSNDQVGEALRGKSEQRANGNQPIAALFKADSIGSDGFDLQLLAQGGLGSRPKLRGTIAPCSSGSRVTVIAHLSDPFSLVWSVGLVLAGLVALGGISGPSDLPVRLAISAVAAGIVAAYWWITARMFDTGVLTAGLALKDILNAEIEVTSGPVR